MTDRSFLKWISDTEVYRGGPLVYVRTLKCASTYYSEEFLRNGWTKTSVRDIDWQNDHVFSFIMDPLDRRLKGLAEFISMYPGTEKLLDQDSIFWKKLTSIDMHSVSYHLTYHDYVRKIDWIPIDSPHYKSEELVIKLCQFYKIDLNLSYNKKNTSSNAQKLIRQKIKDLTGDGSAELYLALEKDMFLYHDVCNSISPDSNVWDEISWLKNNS